ncbi:MmgE/PrpD family protein [soil metagenome]
MLTRAVASHLAGLRFEDLPSAAVIAAKRSLLDAVAVTLAASGIGEGCGPFIDLAREAGGRAEATVLGAGFKAPLAAAVLANGAMAHALDFEDSLDGAPVHPNAASTPVALALAEALPGVTGRDLITALAVGCDLTCRLGLALTVNPDDYGFYPPPILSAFGAVATAGKLLKLDERGLLDAFALVLSQAVASAEFKGERASVIRAIRDAFPAQAALQSALLASKGVRGFDTALEGKAGLFALYARGAYDPNVITDRLGSRFYGTELSLKPWPSCRGTHAFIEAALTLSARYGLTSADIEALIATGGPVQVMLVEPAAQKRAPATAIDAKFSIPFTVAAALVKGAITLETFDDLTDPEVLALARKVSFVRVPGADMRTAASGALEIRTTDGRLFAMAVSEPLGAPSNPMTEPALVAKFVACAGYAASPVADPTALAARLLAVDEEADLKGLIGALAG